VSALSQLAIDDHNRIFTSDARLIRRLVRDRLYRGFTAERTLELWERVRRGEGKWIFPFQEGADVMFNSALVYEPAVLKVFAERFLLQVPRASSAYPEAFRLLKFLSLFVPIFPDEVPQTSLLREFIGGSSFDY
jgi:uridine kinase